MLADILAIEGFGNVLFFVGAACVMTLIAIIRPGTNWKK